MPPSETATILLPEVEEVQDWGGAEDLADALRPAWVSVDLDALAANLAALRRHLGGALAMAVVKADGYGHGAVEVSRALEREGVDWLGVALLEEGAEIRRAGVEVPILVLGTARPKKIALYRRYDLTPTVSSLSELALWRQWADGESMVQPIHLKVDTGMGRLGVGMGELAAALDVVRHSKGLKLAGFLSHFGDADDLESPRNEAQERRFREALGLLTPAEREGALIHMANSAAALHRPASRYDLARLGIALYGQDPAAPLGSRASEDGAELFERQRVYLSPPSGDEHRPEPSGFQAEGGPTAVPDLTPVMSVVARIVQIHEVPAGSPLSYGGRTVTRRASRIAVVPVGYADGYAWRLTGKADALVGGRRVPVAGSVTMDMTLLDVTGTAAGLADEVVLLGRQGEGEIGARELARHAGTISWEILCHLGLRLPRRYVQGGRVHEVASRFLREES